MGSDWWIYTHAQALLANIKNSTASIVIGGTIQSIGKYRRVGTMSLPSVWARFGEELTVCQYKCPLRSTLLGFPFKDINLY
jgi:hypothetical protein